jgi:hypothetical protein
VRLRPATTGRTRFDIGDIVRHHRGALEAQQDLTLAQRRVLSAIEQCRTAALGGHVDVCRSCGHEHPAYNSCRNRHCPKCQALAQERWIAARSERLLPVKHFHVVFTLPGRLRSLARARPRSIYNALLAAASATLAELARSRLAGARLGVTMVLHTWTRDLRFHPHVHAIVTAGGLSEDDSRWIASSPKYLFPVKVMGALLRGKMIAALRDLHRSGAFEGLDSLAEPGAFDHLVDAVARTNWVVYAKKAFRCAEHVMAYLGRYTHRVAIANSRLVNVTDDEVTFRTKDGKTVTLPPVAFLWRLVLHVLPHGLHKIRHYGLYSSALARPGGKLDVARHLLAPDDARSPAVELRWVDLLFLLTGRDVSRCPRCGGSVLRVLVPPISRGPPPRRIAA